MNHDQVLYITGFILASFWSHGLTQDGPVTGISLSSYSDLGSLYAGNKTTFICESNGGKPQPDIYWFLDSEPFKEGNTTQLKRRSAVLVSNTFFLDKRMDKKVLFCEAKNKAGSKRANLTLNVRYSAFVEITYDSEKGILSCTPHGNPDEFKFLGWSYKSGQSNFVSLTSNSASSSNPWQLHIRANSFNDTGLYTCAASNGIGEPGRTEYFVKTNSPPIFLNPQTTYSMTEYANISINFTFYSSPSVNQFSFKREGVITPVTDWNTVFSDTSVTLPVRGQPMELIAQTATIEITNVSLSQAGNYSLTLITTRGASNVLNLQIFVSEEEAIITTSVPVVYEGGLGAGIIVLIVVIIINVVVCLGILYWRIRKSRQKQLAKPCTPREKVKFLPRERDNVSGQPPIPPKRTTSARKVQPTIKSDSNYAELDFSGANKGCGGIKVIRKEPPTEYAWIDFGRAPGQLELVKGDTSHI